ncbi:MAG: hypothetical protein IIC66_11555 [candidate division Zixibacteria bacterium]|nr:hypothetical protein [candidate division Zixibacteria bacterium]
MKKKKDPNNRIVIGMKCTIKGDSGEFVSIDVLNYDNPNSPDVDDANWLACNINLSISPFQAKIKASLRTEDFVQFANSVERLRQLPTSKVAVFETMEEWLTIEIEKDKLGKLIINGLARDVDKSNGSSLKFAFCSDQTYLKPLLSEINSIINKFPVREK